MTKLSISRAWEETREVLARDGKLIGTVGLAMFVLPGIVLNLALPKSESGQLPPMGPWVIVGLVVLLVTLVGQLAVIRLSIAPHVSVGEAIAHGGRRLLPYLASVLLWIVPVLLIGGALISLMGNDPAHPSGPAALGLLLLTLAGTFLGVRLILALAVASAEPVGPISILRRSWELTRGNWWRLFGFLLLFVVAAFVLIISVEAVAGVIAKLLFGDISPLSVGGLLVSIIAQLVSGFVSVILFVMLARIYAQRAGAGEAQVSVPSSGI